MRVMTDVRNVAGQRARDAGACAEGFLGLETPKLDLTALLSTTAGVAAVVVVVRMVNLYFAGF